MSRRSLAASAGGALLARLTLCSLVLAFGCSRSETAAPESKPAPEIRPAKPAPPPAPAPAAASVGDAEAKKLFQMRCVVCHGQNGKGDGPGAAALNPKPRDYTNVEWQKSVTDEHIADIVVRGGAAVGKSPNMPPNPDLAAKPEVVKGLVKVVRSFAQ